MLVKDIDDRTPMSTIRVKVPDNIPVHGELENKPITEGYIIKAMETWFITPGIVDGKQELYLLGDEFFNPKEILKFEVIQIDL